MTSQALSVLSAVASVSATLFGISIAVVAILPPVLESLASSGSRLQLHLGIRRLRIYFMGVGAATLAFCLSAVVSVLGLGEQWTWTVGPSIWTCITGIALLAISCFGVLLEISPTLSR